MTVTSISQLKDALSEFLNRAAYGQERIIVASRGKPKAAVISINDLDLLEELEDALAAREALEAHSAGETIIWEDAKAELLIEDDGIRGRDRASGAKSTRSVTMERSAAADLGDR